VENVIFQWVIRDEWLNVHQFASLRQIRHRSFEKFAPQRQGSMRAEEVACSR
jgi:hypothetical protein